MQTHIQFYSFTTHIHRLLLIWGQAWQNGKDKLVILATAAGGGLRMAQQPMTATMLKGRIANDEQRGIASV